TRDRADGDRHRPPRRRSRVRSALRGHGRDAAVVSITAILFTVAWPTLHVTHQVPAPVQLMIAAAAALPLLLVLRHPVLGLAVSLGSAVVIGVAFEAAPSAPGGPPWQVVHIIVLLALFMAAALTAPAAQVALAW